MLPCLLIVLSRMFTLLRWGLLILIILFLFPYAKAYINDASQYDYLNSIDSIEKSVSEPIDKELKKVVPTTVNDYDISPFLRILLALILSSYCQYFAWRCNFYGKYIKQKRVLQRFKAENLHAEGNDMMTALNQKLTAIESSKSKVQSATLLEEFIELKKKMESMSRYLAFLSIDIVDSTGIKESEDKAMIQYDFLQYKRFVQKIFDKNQCIKAAWTPDGVMSCYDTVDQAAATARDVLLRLQYFNAHEKNIERDFIVRCGINAGVVYFDESLPIEEMTDQVIDVAGHMQKYAEPGTIAISKPSIEPLEQRHGFSDVGREVDGFGVFEWVPEPTDKSATSEPMTQQSKEQDDTSKT